VGGIDLVGKRDREIQILVDPAKLSGRGLTVEDLANAVRAQNLELPAGYFDSGARELTVKTKGEVKTAAEVADVVIPSAPGTIVRVRDVAEVVDGTEEARSASSLDGRSAISLVIRKQSGLNTVAVADAVKKALKEITPRVEKMGAKLDVPTDNSTYIARSIHD